MCCRLKGDLSTSSQASKAKWMSLFEGMRSTKQQGCVWDPILVTRVLNRLNGTGCTVRPKSGYNGRRQLRHEPLNMKSMISLRRLSFAPASGQRPSLHYKFESGLRPRKDVRLNHCRGLESRPHHHHDDREHNHRTFFQSKSWALSLTISPLHTASSSTFERTEYNRAPSRHNLNMKKGKPVQTTEPFKKKINPWTENPPSQQKNPINSRAPSLVNPKPKLPKRIDLVLQRKKKKRK